MVQEIYEATSLSVQEEPFNISIYPNPVSDGFLNIINPSKEPLNISIYDIIGRNDVGPVYDGDPIFTKKAEYYGQPLFAVAATTTAAFFKESRVTISLGLIFFSIRLITALPLSKP